MDITDAFLRAETEDKLLSDISEHFASALKVDSCDILLPTTGGGLVFRASTASPELAGRLRLGKGVGLAGHVLESNETVNITNGLSQNQMHRNVMGVHEGGFESAVVAPIPGAGGAAVGVIYLQRRRSWKLTAAERKELESMADQLGRGLRIFRSAYDAGAQTSRMGVFTEATRTLSDSLYLEETLQLLVNLTARRFNYKVVTVRLRDEKSGELILRATQATNKAYQRKRAISLGESIAGRAIAENRTVIVQDVQTDQDYVGHDLAEEQGLRSMICIPLTVQQRPLGVLSCYTGEVREFTDDEVNALETLAKQAAVSIEHTRLQVKNTLMQEMHHRVKNNLQQVAALLRLQQRQSHYESQEQALEDSLSRILAIASVHELLSRDDLDHVSVKSIAEMLGQHQQTSFVLPGKHIAFSVRGDDVFLNTNQATQIALILNEMIQNAVEHGFRDKSEGEIHITIEDHDDQIGIWVSNDGDRLPPDFDPKQGHLGLQIIRSLVGALGGKFVMEDRLGWTVCQVTFQRQASE